MDNAIRINDRKLRNLTSFLMGLLIGSLVGLATMILFAPQSGKETRAQIREKNTELQQRTMDTFDDLVNLSQFDNREILIETRKNGRKAVLV